MKKMIIILISLIVLFPTRVKADELLNIDATAYCVSGTTATGTQTVEGRTAAGHPDWYGMTAYVWEDTGEGIQPENLIGVYTMEDTGKKGGKVRNGGCIDVYLTDYERCIEFGRKKVFVWLVKE